jgi:hypothetical protein
MSEYKGVVVEHARKLLREAGIPEAKLIERLPAEEANLFRATTAMSWIPLSPAVRIIREAGELLFPDEPRSVWAINRSAGKATITGIYRILVKALTMQGLIERSARLWSTFFKKGKTRVDRGGDGRACLVVEDYPDIDLGELEGVEGYIHGLMEAAGAKDIRVTTDDADPNAWKWHFSWR